MASDKELMVDLSGAETESVKRLFEKGVTIPPQPRVLQELQASLTRGNADVRSLAKIISQDPGIVATLFKVVQNAVFRRYQPFASVEHVLQAVGMQQTTNLVRAIALSSVLPAKHNRGAFEAYWARSQAIADLAMIIAGERVSVCNVFPDQACLAGVFHDCGVPVLMQRFPNYCKDMHLEAPDKWAELSAEDANFGVDHAVIGYLVGRHWKLPDAICDTIRYHHDLSRIENHTSRSMVAILQLAIHFYLLDRQMVNPEWAAISADVLDELGLSEDGLPEVCDIVLERYRREA